MGFLDRFFRKSSEPPGRDDFAKLLMTAIRLAGEPGNITYDSKEFRLTGEGKQAFAYHLFNAYKEVLRCPR